jgi:hypothetical protein
MCRLRHCIVEGRGLEFDLLTYSENNLSNEILERIAQELRLMNVNMTDANDIATLAAFPTMPADLDNDSRKALQQLRKKIMKRARSSADL